MSIGFPRPVGTAHDLIVQKRHNYATYRYMAVNPVTWGISANVVECIDVSLSHQPLKSLVVMLITS